MNLLAGDIGGTKSWLAWAQANTAGWQVQFEQVYASADFASAAALLQRFVADAQTAIPPDAVCLALPGPVQPGQPVRLTNLDWTLETTAISRQLQTDKVLFLNDFAAAAQGLASLTAADYVTLASPTATTAGRIRAITGPGTGLGLAWLQQDDMGQWHVFATEGGHTDFAPADAQQERLLAFMRQHFAHVSWERVLSGPRVNHVWQFCLHDMTGSIPTALAGLNGAAVNQRAQAGDAVAQAAMQLFADIYANWVGNVALLYQPTGGIYLAGGITARIQPWLQTARFIERCTDKGRMAQLVKNIPIHMVTNTRLGLQGALTWAHQQFTQGDGSWH